MATFWERAAHSVNNMFSLNMYICNFGFSHFGFKGQAFGSDCISSWSLLTFYECAMFFDGGLSLF